MKVLLINSEKPRTGKSTLVQTLKQNYEGIYHTSFAGVIKTLSIDFAENLLNEFNTEHNLEISYNTETKDKPIGDIFGDTTPRELVCDVSDLYSKCTHPNIWAMLAYNTIQKAQNAGYKIVIFDDWRRPLEYEYLKSFKDLDIETLYLSKEDIEYTPTSDSVASFEGNITALDCDMAFEFTSDWSNTKDLITILSITLGLKHNG